MIRPFAPLRLIPSLTLALAGCPHPVTLPPREPISCEEAWRAVPPALRTFDQARDGRRTALGEGGYSTFTSRLPPRSTCRKEWTVLIYMAAGSDDLRAQAFRDIEEMEAPFPGSTRSAASTARADVIVQLDMGKEIGGRRLHLFRAPAAARKAPEIRTMSDIRSPIVAPIEGVSEDEPRIPPADRLATFLGWGTSEYPSERTWVIVWGHGLGWRPKLPDDASVRWSPQGLSGGIAFDASRGTAIDTPSLRRALGGTFTGAPVDLYTSDACLMQSLEVATEISWSARFLVGAEQIEDYSGLPYRAMIPLVNGFEAPPEAPACPPGDTACRVAAAIPELSKRELAKVPVVAGSAPTRDAFTLSTLSTKALLGSLHPAMHRLAAAIDAFLVEDPLRRIDVGVLLGDDAGTGEPRGLPGFLGGTRDVGVLLARLDDLARRDSARTGGRATPAAARLGEAIAAARAALRETVIAAAFGPRYADGRHAGMAGVSVWLPHDAAELARRLEFFASARFFATSPSEAPTAEPSAWRGFLQRALGPRQ